MATPAPLIVPRSYQRTLDVIRSLRLAETDPQLTLMLRGININRPSLVDVRVWTMLQERVTAITKSLQERPFLNPPPCLQDGQAVIGILHNGNLVRVPWRDLAKHVLITAASGGGKTTYLHFLQQQALDAGIRVWILDAKKDAKYLAVRNNFLLFRALRYNPLQRPSFMSLADHIATIISCFTRAFFGHEQTKNLLNELLHRLYRETSQPCMADLKNLVDRTYTVKETFTRREANRNVASKLQRAQDAHPDLFTTKQGVTPEVFCEHNLYYDVTIMTETDEFLWSLLVHQLFFYQQQPEHEHHRGTLHTILSIDEGLLTLGGETTSFTNSRISGPVLSPIHGMAREAGIGFFMTTYSLAAMTPTIKTSVFLHAAMGLSDGKEADEITRTYGLNQQQREYLMTRIKTGEAIIRLNDDRWRHPLLLTFPKLDQETKTVTSEEWNAALQRTKDLYQEPPTTTTSAKPFLVPSPAEKPPDMPAEPPRVKPVALSVAEESLMRTVARETIMTVMNAYDAANLSRQVGDRASKKTEALGYLTRTPITVHERTGGTAVALQLTNAGYERLGTKPAHGPRGGSSAQHTYLVMNIAKCLPGSTVETTLGGMGGKSVDLLLPVQQAVPTLLPVIAANAHCLAETGQTGLRGNELLAIEVETTSDTVVNNVTKNPRRGLQHDHHSRHAQSARRSKARTPARAQHRRLAPRPGH